MSLTQACKILLNAFSFLALVEFAEFHTIKACSEAVLLVLNTTLISCGVCTCSLSLLTVGGDVLTAAI